MKYLFLLLNIVFQLNANSQLNNSNSVIAIPKSDIVKIYHSVDSIDCTGSGYKTLENIKQLIIYDYYACGKGFESKEYFRILKQGKTFYLECNDCSNKAAVIAAFAKFTTEEKRNYQNTLYAQDSIIEVARVNQFKNFYKKATTTGIIILDAKLYDQSEYVDGTGFSIEVLNPTSKTIKYITFNVVALNPVKDKVYSTKYKSYTVSLKGVGPIQVNESSKYDFAYTWLSDLPTTFKIISIKIEYMDKSVKNINDINSITLPAGLTDLL